VGLRTCPLSRIARSWCGRMVVPFPFGSHAHMQSKKTSDLSDHGVNCYSSASLAGPWTFEGQVLRPEPACLLLYAPSLWCSVRAVVSVAVQSCVQRHRPQLSDARPEGRPPSCNSCYPFARVDGFGSIHPPRFRRSVVWNAHTYPTLTVRARCSVNPLAPTCPRLCTSR
jgi:hypothetical protein